MALTTTSITRAARRKAQSAQAKVRSAEAELMVANDALKHAIPKHDVEVIAEAAEHTITAEAEVREAAQELEAVSELLHDGSPPPPETGGGASGEGVRSLLDKLKRRK